MSEHHITPLRTYLIIAGILLFLSGLTVWVSYFDFGPLNVIIAMGVASLKATLVALFFMHLLWDDKKNLTIFVMSLMFLAIFIIITLLDTGFRVIVNPETQYPINKRAAFYDSLPLTDTHGNPVDEHGSDHHEEDEDHQ
ncbi:MAG TPA: cytochrome C oxidase subunit IV family protein [Candidatus Marinimicrobia bacterium]|nr:cytochrome C oxidase subunit IV family protein [Candidatus Neomarinimicrobiota bacterium]